MNSAGGFRKAATEPWDRRSAAGKLASTFGGRAFRPKSRRKMHFYRTGGQNGGRSPESPGPPEMHLCAILVRLVLMMLILPPADDGRLTARRGLHAEALPLLRAPRAPPGPRGLPARRCSPDASLLARCCSSDAERRVCCLVRFFSGSVMLVISVILAIPSPPCPPAAAHPTLGQGSPCALFF